MVRTMTELTPSPEGLAELLIDMCTQPWPTTEEERLRYFQALQLQDGQFVDEPPPHRKPDRQSRWFTTPLPGQVDGISNTFRGQFLGLSMFAYNQPGSDAAPARDGYAALQALLNQAFGDPDEEWGPPTEPACLWRPGPLLLDMYCFQRGSSGVMLGPSHADRTAANNADAIRRQKEQPRRSLTAPALNSTPPTSGENR